MTNNSYIIKEKLLNKNIISEQKETILVIDDSSTNIEILYTVLGCAGYNVIAENNGIKGIECIKIHKPDLVLLDVMMPGIDGFETCRRLQAEASTKDIPVIFMTALSETEKKIQGLSLGAVDYITKPFQQEEILARIQVHLKLRRLNLELDQQKLQLEQRVEERTTELFQALEELKKTQLQLVQTEKISTLGQLVSGVAHEVNNPIGFISTNVYYANQYIQDLIKLVKLYQNKFPNPGEEIEIEVEAINLEHVLEDLPKLISSMRLGSDRIQGIMQSLRTFSRADGVDKKSIDIHEGLETTLMILQHRLKGQPYRPAIQIFKEYGNLPKIECYPGQLNQVFMNLLANAIDALEEGVGSIEWGIVKSQYSNAYSSLPAPLIRISTSADREYVTIRIADNGPGMSELVRSQIFDPFFTTKSSEKGTGLGLSICSQIINEKHGGNLHCISSEGEGTEFIIQIPFKNS
jgi:two-component system, NtrC family, sensor kinase